MFEIDWLLNDNLVWGQRLEKLAQQRGLSLNQMAEMFPALALLYRLRTAEKQPLS